MGILDGIKSVFGGRGNSVRVVDAMHNPPTQANVPSSWSRGYMGPGTPMGGLETIAGRNRDNSAEPRTFQYPPGVNATISPRAAYGLLPFTDLRYYAENVPEVAMCIRILTEEIKSFEPRILDNDENEVDDPALRWMLDTPDMFNPWPVWLSRFLYNVLVYDAGALYTPRDSRGHIMAMRVVDGSTIFVLVDEHGEIPQPPAPAYTQVIYGTPRNYLNTYQMWYRPRHLRADAPYGRSAIEECLPSIKLMENLWDYEQKWFTEGTLAEQTLTAPESWTPDQIIQFEQEFNARMAGNTEERAGRVRFMPAGTQALVSKDTTFKQELYDVAANTIRMTFGIPRTEFGESPGSGLGGSGFLEAMQSVFFRLGLAPLKMYIESAFNEVLETNGYPYHMELAFPKESIDPKKEEDKAIARFTQGLSTRDEARQALGLNELGGEEGKFMVSPGQQSDPSQLMPGGFPASMIPVKDKIPVSRKISVSGNEEMIPVADNEDETILVRKMLTGVEPEDDQYFGMPPITQGNILTIGGGRFPQEAVRETGNHAYEAVYLLDRALAPDDQRYLVPVTYQTEIDGKSATVQAGTGKKVVGVDKFDTSWIMQAAVLDYIAGVDRRMNQFSRHPEDPARPILDNALACSSPTSSFLDAVRGQDIPDDLKQSIETVTGDSALWRDIEDIAGTEAAAAAKDRAVILQTTGRIPAAE